MKHTARLAAASLSLAFAFSLASCSGSPTRGESSGASASAAATGALTRDEAVNRFKQVARVSYNLWFGLEQTREEYEGRAVVNFELKPQAPGRQLFLDFEGAGIKSIVLNGTSLAQAGPEAGGAIPSGGTPGIPKSRFDGKRIWIQLSEARAGQNRLEISFTGAYSKNGNGLYRFKDPADNRVYLYSNFEPYSAHRMFPCFDQPDLKASFELTVEAPEDWEVVSNTRERDTTEIQGRKSWAFPPSPLLAPYVFALHAGPYASWKGDADGIPMRLFARQSLKQYVDSKEWFEITAKGLDYYNTQFGYPYPYSKYDQILAPDFNVGAMENAAAVTFTERYVFRTKVTQDTHRRRADTILHEMAHMWFGDLVTMKWWNGLWLNESFATFSSSGAIEKSTSFPNQWLAFFVGNKQWAYWEDQLVTTHPIEVPVPDTDTAESIFDGVTYGKGAAVLKQLAFFLGEDDFREGIQRYFQKYALRNTTINDFIRMLSEASSKDLTRWQKQWLLSPGPNTLRADWACADSAGPDGKGKVESRVSKFALVQGNAETSTELRSHRTRVALFKFGGKGGESAAKQVAKQVHDEFDVQYAGAETNVADAIGKPCPDFVYPNYGDYDYAKVILDPTSMKVAAARVSDVRDLLTRAMLWHTLWEMVSDGLMKPQDYAEAVLAQAAREKDTQILARILRTLLAPQANRPSAVKYLAPTMRADFQARAEKLLTRELDQAPAGSDLQLVYFAAFLDAATQQSVDRVHKILDGGVKLAGFKIDQERRWSLVKALARIGVADAQALIDAELKKDPTDNGAKAAIGAEAAIPDAAVKTRWMQRILAPISASKAPPAVVTAAAAGSPSAAPTVAPSDAPLKIGKLREAMTSFHELGQEQFTQGAVDAYFDAIPSLAKADDEEYASRFATSFYPSLCDAAIAERTTATLKRYPDLPAYVVKALKQNRQEEERCVRSRNLAGSQPAPRPN